MTHFYRHSGIVLQSDFPVPEWDAFASGSVAEPDVRFCLTDSIADAPPPDCDGVWSDGVLTFSVENEGVWSIAGGSKITVAPADLARMDDARLFTLGSAWGALGYQRGWAMLHGSCVSLDGKAALFCGDAEQGKSTMAAAMTGHGAWLLADDLSRVDAGEGQIPLIYPSSARIKLWDSAIAHLGWQARDKKRDHFRDDKYHFALDTDPGHADPRTLDAVFVLAWGNRIACDRLRGIDAVKALSEASMYRREFLDLMGCVSGHVIAATRIAAAIPIYRLTRPRDFALLPRLCATIADHMKEPRIA